MPRQTLLPSAAGAEPEWPEGLRVRPEMSVSHTDCFEMILGFLPQPLVIAGEPIGMPFLCQFSVGGLYMVAVLLLPETEHTIGICAFNTVFSNFAFVRCEVRHVPWAVLPQVIHEHLLSCFHQLWRCVQIENLRAPRAGNEWPRHEGVIKSSEMAALCRPPDGEHMA